MRVTVWHNTGPAHHTGYLPEHPMLRVFSHTSAGTDAEREMWRAVEMFTTAVDLLAPQDRATAAAYGERGLRSLADGDGFSVQRADGGREEFWTVSGCVLAPRPGPFPLLALEGGPGSVPLGLRVTYLVPTVDDLVREGLFDAAGTPEKAVAAHHGVAAQDVVVLTGPR
ncbi:hypothetical protein [Streptomyces sp. NPDC001889]